MYPTDVMFEVMKLHIEDLQREAAHARLVPTSKRRRRSEPLMSFFWSGLRLRKAHSKVI